MLPKNLCSHLAADGPYREVCEELVPKFPNLRHRDYKHARLTSLLVAGTYSRFRFVSIDVSCGAARVGSTAVSLTEVERCLSTKSQTTPTRRLYVLEGQSPEIFALLGLELKVDPRVLVRHQRTALYDAEQDGGNSPCLASLINSNYSYSLEIYEPRHFPGGFQSGSLECTDSLRHVMLPGKDGRFQDIGIICNKATFWSRSTVNGGWQGSCFLPPGLHYRN